VEGVAPAGCVGLEVGFRVEAREKHPRLPRPQGIQALGECRPAPEGATRLEHSLNRADRRAGEDEEEPATRSQMVPHRLHDAGEPRGGAGEIGNLVQDEDQGLVAGQSAEEAKRRLPAGEAPGGEIGLPGAQIPADGLMEPAQLHRLGLTGGHEEHRPLPPHEVRQQEGLAHTAPAPQDRKLRPA